MSLPKEQQTRVLDKSNNHRFLDVRNYHSIAQKSRSLIPLFCTQLPTSNDPVQQRSCTSNDPVSSLGVPPQLDTKRHRFNVMGRTPVATPTMIAPARLLQLTMIAPARRTIVVFSKATVPPSMRGYSS
jgi:hypothetical protein